MHHCKNPDCRKFVPKGREYCCRKCFYSLPPKIVDGYRFMLEKDLKTKDEFVIFFFSLLKKHTLNYIAAAFDVCPSTVFYWKTKYIKDAKRLKVCAYSKA